MLESEALVSQLSTHNMSIHDVNHLHLRLPSFINNAVIHYAQPDSISCAQRLSCFHFFCCYFLLLWVHAVDY